MVTLPRLRAATFQISPWLYSGCMTGELERGVRSHSVCHCLRVMSSGASNLLLLMKTESFSNRNGIPWLVGEQTRQSYMAL